MIDQAVAGGTGRAVEAARQRARALGHPVLLSRTDRMPTIDPTELFSRGARLGPERAYWERPDQGAGLVGLGAAWAFESGSSDRFRAAARAWTGLVADADLDEGAEVGPLLLGGFAFDPTRPTTERWRGFPDARLVLPRLLLTRRGDDCWLTVSQLVGADADPAAAGAALERDLAVLRAPADQAPASVTASAPFSVIPSAASCARRDSGRAPADRRGQPRVVDLLPAAEWRSIVAAATDAIERGQAEKIVLARAVKVDPGGPVELTAALRRLRASYPTCAIFALANEAGCFLGATPERLVRLSDGEVSVSCLAGTVARGRTADEDERLGAELLASHKNREEHAFVVRELAEQLAAGVADLDVPAEPALMKVRNLQHLYTPLRGRLLPGGSLLELVERLHPTPAVGGRPRETALRFIREHERLDRGWYAGPVGWLDARGDGEFVVALRSGLVGAGDAGTRGTRRVGRGHGGAESASVATLFAGCGIVAESDPAAEYAESVLKLAPMLSALGGA